MEEPGCTSGSAISARFARGPAPSHRMSLANEDGPVHRALRLEVVLGLAHLDTKALGEPLADLARELGVGVDAGADGRTTQCDFREVLLGFLYALYAALNLPGVPLELLAEADRGGVLQVRPTRLYYVVELPGLVFERLLELLQRR
jgi:cytochrome P450